VGGCKTVLYVAVIGPSGADQPTINLAFSVGRQLASEGVVVLVGSTKGVSFAASEGARSINGTVITLLPGSDREGLEGQYGLTIPTGLGELCNGVLVGAAHAAVSIGGSWGTLIEIAYAIRTGVPVISLEGWCIQDISGVRIKGVIEADTPEDAVTRAHQAALSRMGQGT
jgi:uncharacterized protein (TIGR00725 family)